MNDKYINEFFASGLSKITLNNCIDGKGQTEVKKRILNRDVSLLYAKRKKQIDINNITELPSGRISTVCEGVNVEMFFNYKPNKPLIVVLNGSLMASYPEFKRWSWYNFVEGSMLNIADPMYELFSDLKLGWYYGTDTIDVRGIIANIIQKIASFLGLSNDNIILYGSSGGAAASFEVASRIPGSTCIAINPQIYLDEYFYYETFKKITGQDPRQNSNFRNDVQYWINKDKKTKFIIVSNLCSPDDKMGITKLSQSFNMPLFYGINKKENLIIWCYTAVTDEPHNAQEDYCMHFPIMFLKNFFNDTLEIDSFKNLYILFSELWNNKWLLEQEKTDINKRVAFISNNVTIVYAQSNIEIVANDTIYNAITLDLSLEPDTLYLIDIKDAYISNSSCNQYVLGIKNKKQNHLISKQTLSNGSSHAEFYTSKDTNGLELKIYAGEPAKTSNIGLKIGNLTISSRKIV